MLNRTDLIGYVGRDPEMRTLETGVQVAKFSLATTETWKDAAGEKKEHTEWHDIVVWRGLASVVERLVRKGSKVFISGKLRKRTYQKDDETRYYTEIIADTLLLLDKPDKNGYWPGQDDELITADGHQSKLLTARTVAPPSDQGDDLIF